MYRTLVPTLQRANTDAPRQRLATLGRQQQLPTGRDAPLHERLRNQRLLTDQAWTAYKQGFRELKAEVQGVYLGSNDYPDTPFFLR